MTTTEHRMQRSAIASSDQDLEQHRATAGRRVSRAMTTIRSSAVTLAGRAPGAARAAQARAADATSALQRLPDSTLRWLAAGSLGVAAGFQLAGVPRLIRAAGAAPALLLGAAIALRPTDEHTRGVSTAEETVEVERPGAEDTDGA